MRMLFSSDWHVGSYGTGPMVNGVNDRLKDLANRIQQIRDYALRERIEWLVVPGDLFKNRQPDNVLLAIMAQFIHAFQSCGIKVMFSTGNHDVYLVEGRTHALNVFKSMQLPGVWVFDEPSAVVVEGVKFLFFPYLGAPQDAKLREAIAKFPGCDVLVMHGSVEGGVVNRNSEFEIHDSDEVKFDTVSPFKLVLAGHLHSCHNVGHVWYAGSIEQLTFDDEGVPKMFLDVTIQDGQVSVKKVPLDHRELVTLTYDQLPQVMAGELDVRDKVVRMTETDEDQTANVVRILREKGCYHVSGVYRKTPDQRPVEQVDARKLDVGQFVRKYAEAVKYEGDLDSAVRTFGALLES